MIGRHRGLHFHTIGQRRGVGPVLDPKGVHRGPWFVAANDAESNVLYVTTQYQLVTSPRSGFTVEDVNWIAGAPPLDLWTPHKKDEIRKKRNMNTVDPLSYSRCEDQRQQLKHRSGEQDESAASCARLTVQVRHGPDTHLATVRPVGPVPGSDDDSLSYSKLLVSLDGTDKGLAPGQYAAFYDGDTCLGAGIIADRSLDEIQACINDATAAAAATNTIINKQNQ